MIVEKNAIEDPEDSLRSMRSQTQPADLQAETPGVAYLLFSLQKDSSTLRRFCSLSEPNSTHFSSTTIKEGTADLQIHSTFICEEFLAISALSSVVVQAEEMHSRRGLVNS